MKQGILLVSKMGQGSFHSTLLHHQHLALSIDNHNQCHVSAPSYFCSSKRQCHPIQHQATPTQKTRCALDVILPSMANRYRVCDVVSKRDVETCPPHKSTQMGSSGNRFDCINKLILATFRFDKVDYCGYIQTHDPGRWLCLGGFEFYLHWIEGRKH